MDPVTNQARPLIARDVLRLRVEERLRTRATEEALDAMIHSLECVLGQHLRAAWNSLRDEVADLVLRDEFEDIPLLEPRHFLATYRGSSDSLQDPGPGYEPGPSV